MTLCIDPLVSPPPESQWQALCQALPSDLFRSGNEANSGPAWRISPAPFPLAPRTVATITALGGDLAAFLRVLGGLYTRSVRGTAPGFIAEYLDAGKPESIIKLARQNRFKSDIPGVIRPDLILTEGGFIASEIDSVPGGMGFVGAMTHAYSGVGADSIGGLNGMIEGFAQMLLTLSEPAHPHVAIVVSAESQDYRNELTWLAEQLNASQLASATVCSPQDIIFTEEALFVRSVDGREAKIDVLYRNFELFDLQNVPKSELMLYAARHQRVKMTPPPRAPLEEKMSFALLHHPRLAKLWSKELGEEVFRRLRALFPQTWVLDPRPLPPQAAISGLEVAGEPVNDWQQLLELGKKERDYVVKPSGFSELAWGSRGVTIANDLTKEAWAATLHTALAAYPHTPHILQRFHKGRRVKTSYFDANGVLTPLEGRVRLCPYYFVTAEETKLGGILATIAPADKRLIHGMSDAIMTTCRIDENGY